MEIFERIRHQRGPLGQYAHLGEGYYMFPELHGEIGSRMIFNGKEVVVWSINNYLGLANHPEVRKTDAEAAARWGLAYPMGARLMTGETSLHLSLIHIYCEGKSASVATTGGSDAAAKLASMDSSIETKTCPVTGTVSYVRKETCAGSGTVSYVDVNYDAATNTFVNVSPMKMEGGKDCGTKGTSCLLYTSRCV